MEVSVSYQSRNATGVVATRARQMAIKLGREFLHERVPGRRQKRLTPIGNGTLALAAKLDAEALYCVRRFLLWDLDDPASALPYLEAAAARGNLEAAIDMLTLALFQMSGQR
jgi:hypothetical protein